MLLSCSSEQKDDCITNMGDIVSIDRDVMTFDKLYVEDRIKVILVQDSTQYGRIELNGPSNLLDQIESNVSNKQLRLNHPKLQSFHWSLPKKGMLYILVLGNQGTRPIYCLLDPYHSTKKYRSFA